MGFMLSRKLRHQSEGVIEHWCPGCNSRHAISINGAHNHSGATWTWNGDVDRPTFHPSVHITLGPWNDEEGFHPKTTDCHYFITNGQIQFCEDSAHALKGKSLELPDWPDRFLDDILMTIRKD